MDCLMSLYIWATFELAVQMVVYCCTCDYVSRNSLMWYSNDGWESIQSKHLCIYNFNKKPIRKFLERKWSVDWSCAFFYGPDITFSGTCSSFDTMFSETPRKIALGSSCSGSPSPSIWVMWKPKCVYILTIFLRALYIGLWVRSGIACAEPNCIFLDIVLRKVWHLCTLCQLIMWYPCIVLELV